MHRLYTLQGRNALVTGATKGIGRATTKLLLELGARVLAVARTQEDLERAVAEEWSQLGEVHTCAADVAEPDGRRGVLEAAKTCFGESLDILINNVGTNIRKNMDGYPLADVERLMQVNAYGAYELAQGALPLLQASEVGPCIVNVSSVASVNVVGTSTMAYAMTKGALDNMTKWMATGWAGYGIRTNAVLPWYTRTELTAPLLEHAALEEHIAAVTPMGRVAEAEEVAAVIAFACMPAASYLNGAFLPVDGGYLQHGIAAFTGAG